MKTYRSLAIKNLSLKRGDRVIELGCGTGLNFPLLIEQIGSEGRLIGVDLSSKMLVYARNRVERSGWKNVELEEKKQRGQKGVRATLLTGKQLSS